MSLTISIKKRSSAGKTSPTSPSHVDASLTPSRRRPSSSRRATRARLQLVMHTELQFRQEFLVAQCTASGVASCARLFVPALREPSYPPDLPALRAGVSESHMRVPYVFGHILCMGSVIGGLAFPASTNTHHPSALLFLVARRKITMDPAKMFVDTGDVDTHNKPAIVH
jgi:hypothetical protein